MANFADEEHLTGLARDIRGAIGSEQFDLGNYTEQRSHDLVKVAFSAPLTAPNEMVKFTFVVGGGKLVRSRYSDDLTKWMVAALRDIGFTEDRSAAETFDSQGTYKQQHDTGQNLKYLIVYPYVACANKKSASDSSVKAAESQDQSSPEYIITASEFSTFQEIVASKVTTYRQKKHLLKILQDELEVFKGIEEKLISGNLLTPKEQSIYDGNAGNNTEKIVFLQNEIKSMVDGGQLTASEKEELLQNLETNLGVVDAEIAEAKEEKKAKKVEKLEEKKKNIQARKATVSAIAPITHRLRYGDEIQKLRIRLFPLLALEDKGRSCSLTLADLKLLEEKSDIEAAVKSYEASSRGWFEDEADWLEKCAQEEKQAKARYLERAKKSGSGGGGGTKKTGGGSTTGTAKITSGRGVSTGGGGSSISWSTIGVKKSNAPVAPKRVTTASGGFAAAFGDSDSD